MTRNGRQNYQNQDPRATTTKTNPINFSSPFLARYLRLATILWFTGVGLAPEPVGSSETGRRKSYSRRIKRDKLNNCAVVTGATTAQHKH